MPPGVGATFGGTDTQRHTAIAADPLVWATWAYRGKILLSQRQGSPSGRLRAVWYQNFDFLFFFGNLTFLKFSKILTLPYVDRGPLSA